MQSIYFFPTQSVTDTNFQRQRIRQQFCDFLFHWGRGSLVLALNTLFTRTHGKLSLWASHLNVPVHSLLVVSPFLSMANSIFLVAQSKKRGLTLTSIHCDWGPYRKEKVDLDTHTHPGTMPGEHWNNSATSQGTSSSWERSLGQILPDNFRGSTALLIT